MGVALTDEASLELENAPLLLLRINQLARPTRPSPVGRANGGSVDAGRPRPSPSYFPSLRIVGLSASSSPSASGGPIGCRSFRTLLPSFMRPRPGNAAGKLFRVGCVPSLFYPIEIQRLIDAQRDDRYRPGRLGPAQLCRGQRVVSAAPPPLALALYIPSHVVISHYCKPGLCAAYVRLDEA